MATDERPKYGVEYSAPKTASIVISNYNYAPYIRLAIESALAQICTAEIIVVDDGSTDGSCAIVDQFVPRVISKRKPNGGQASALNLGFPDVTGDIVIFLDSDDTLEAQAVQTLLARWEPSTVLAQFPLRIIDESGARLGVLPDPPTSLSHGDVRPELLRTGTFGVNVTSGLAFRREALAEVMPIPKGLRNAADGYLVRAIAFLGQVQRIDEALGSYRRHSSNDSKVLGPSGLAEGFRKKIGYAEQELAATRTFAEMHGMQVDPDFGTRNADYVGYQLSLLLTDPMAKPIGDLNRWRLLRRYVTTRWTSAWPLQRRAFAVGLATAATVSPRTLATTLLRWLHEPQTRPAWLRALAKRMRRQHQVHC